MNLRPIHPLAAGRRPAAAGVLFLLLGDSASAPCGPRSCRWARDPALRMILPRDTSHPIPPHHHGRSYYQERSARTGWSWPAPGSTRTLDETRHPAYPVRRGPPSVSVLLMVLGGVVSRPDHGGAWPGLMSWATSFRLPFFRLSTPRSTWRNLARHPRRPGPSWQRYGERPGGCVVIWPGEWP